MESSEKRRNNTLHEWTLRQKKKKFRKETKYGRKEKSISIKIGTKCGRKGKKPEKNGGELSGSSHLTRCQVNDTIII